MTVHTCDSLNSIGFIAIIQRVYNYIEVLESFSLIKALYGIEKSVIGLWQILKQQESTAEQRK